MNATELMEMYERVADAPDAVTKLRSFVLDLAVRGKLVEQDTNDEPASELLSRMVGQSIAVGADAPGEEPKPFEIPLGWSWTRVGEVCSKTGSGSTPRGGQTAYKSSGVPFLRSQNVYDDGLRLADVVYIDSATHARMSGTAVRPMDLLLNITGGSIGRCCLVPKDAGPANISQHVAIIRPAVEGMSAFMHCLVRSPYFQSFVLDEQTGAGRGGLPKNRMDRISIPLPPLGEQHRIVAKVDELMTRCDQLEAARSEREAARDRLAAASLARLNAPDPDTFRADVRFALNVLPALSTRPDQVKQLRQSILNLAVRGVLVPQLRDEQVARVPDIDFAADVERRLDFDLPNGWRWVRVQDVAEARLGKMLDKAKNKGRPYTYLRNTNVHWFDIRLHDLKTIPLGVDDFNVYRLEPRDVLICEGGHGIGRTAVWRGELTNVVFQKALHRVRPGADLHPDYFAMCSFVYFDAGIMQAYFTGVGIPHFTGKALAQLVFPLPPIDEQQRIVTRVNELMVLCDQLETSLTRGTDTRSRLLESLLHHALESTTGAAKVA